MSSMLPSAESDLSQRLKEQWGNTVVEFMRARFLDRHARGRTLRTALLQDAATTPSQSNSFCILKIDEYLEQCQVVGAPISYNPQPFLIQPRSIISIRGCFQLSLLQYLGQRLNAPTEALIGHLAFPKSFQVRAVKSQQNPFFTVQMITLGQAAPEFITGRKSRAVQYRRVNIHGAGHFSVEQQVTFIPFDLSHQAWSGLVLNDSGDPSGTTPWSNDTTSEQRFFPLMRSGSCAFDLPDMRNHDLPTGRNDNEYISPDPCYSRAKRDTEFLLDPELCVQDPFVFLCDLLDTSALCWTRFLSFMEEPLDCPNLNADQHAEILLHDKRIIDRANVYFSTVLDFIDQRHQLEWPVAAIGAQVEDIARRVRGDFMQLQTRALSLLDMRTQSIQIIMSTISIQESKKGLEQAERVGLLTLLAFVFIPLTFISSLFGMNVTAFTSPNPSLKYFFAIALPFTAVCVAIPLWGQIRKGYASLCTMIKNRYFGFRVAKLKNQV
ncbi:hypothetical protein N7509_000213 [Penicillium cosmopolitanum]|uniref:Mg2+ transporter protein, CorA-like/Zinc transport protein ZntB n=1 Tax=Penicillium cosmopolitanum TaxID=1131564 RepID=A0A9W9WCF3_9EURO|nr:uncharacterized protein N7509_000213 [Penicillium cosmopolitanum]KAJ5414879.1 hypothetical protein N7509_000213 [Penicillium cosmopolitanum]